MDSLHYMSVSVPRLRGNSVCLGTILFCDPSNPVLTLIRVKMTLERGPLSDAMSHEGRGQ